MMTDDDATADTSEQNSDSNFVTIATLNMTLAPKTSPQSNKRKISDHNNASPPAAPLRLHRVARRTSSKAIEIKIE